MGDLGGCRWVPSPQTCFLEQMDVPGSPRLSYGFRLAVCSTRVYTRSFTRLKESCVLRELWRPRRSTLLSPYVEYGVKLPDRGSQYLVLIYIPSLELICTEIQAIGRVLGSIREQSHSLRCCIPLPRLDPLAQSNIKVHVCHAASKNTRKMMFDVLLVLLLSTLDSLSLPRRLLVRSNDASDLKLTI